MLEIRLNVEEEKESVRLYITTKTIYNGELTIEATTTTTNMKEEEEEEDIKVAITISPAL